LLPKYAAAPEQDPHFLRSHARIITIWSAPTAT
jgi:hypothetical protein